MYSAQWLAVIGFLPTMYSQAGVGAGAWPALPRRWLRRVNMIGNIASGRLLQAALAPSACSTWALWRWALGGVLAFAPDLGQESIR